MIEKRFKELERYLQGLKDKNATAIEKCNVELKVLEERIVQANYDLVEADTKNDHQKYAAARDKKRTNEDVKEFFLNKKRDLENVSLITKEEYNNRVNEVMGLMDEYNETQTERVAELLKQMEVIADETLEARNFTDKLLNILQYDLYKREGQKVLPGGTIVEPCPGGGTVAISPMEYKKNIVAGLYNQIRGMGYYKAIMNSEDE